MRVYQIYSRYFLTTMNDDIDQKYIEELISNQHLINLTKKTLDYYILIGELEAENKFLRDKLKEYLDANQKERLALRKEEYINQMQNTILKLQKIISGYRKNPPVSKNASLLLTKKDIPRSG